jgi:putative hydrolase of the HAD superfamily
MINAILFDLDNTLTDTYLIKTKCIKQSLKKMIKAGLEMDFKNAYELIMDVYKKSDYESTSIFEDFLKKAIGKIDYKILSAGIVEYRKIRYKYVKPYDKIKKMLNILRKNNNLILGILTDSPKIKAWIRLTSINLVNYFDLIITYDDVLKKKPNTKAFNKAIKLLKLKPEEILFVGDIPYKDIKAAKEVGMKTALAKYGQFIKGTEKPDYILNSPMDLIKVIKKENK